MEFHKSQSSVRYCCPCQTRPPYSSLFYCLADDSSLSTSFAEENALVFTLPLNHQLNDVNNWLPSNPVCINKIYDLFTNTHL